MIKLNLHSQVELITNSSTVIFIYSEGAVQAVKDLINEMLKVFNVADKTVDDLFYIETFLTNTNYYKENEDEKEDNNAENEVEFPSDDIDIVKVIDDVLTQKIEKPQWMIDAEEIEDYYDYFKRPTQLYIKAKDEKYSKLANNLLKYLNSTYHKATHDG